MKTRAIYLTICLFLIAHWGVRAEDTPALDPAAQASKEAEPQVPFVYDSRGARDPFWLLVSASGTILNFEKNLSVLDMALEGIIFDVRGNSYAIINGEIVRQGQEIGGYVVLRIERDKVVLQKESQEFILNLPKN